MPTSVLLLYWLTNVSTDCRFISFFMHGRSTEPFSLSPMSVPLFCGCSRHGNQQKRRYTVRAELKQVQQNDITVLIFHPVMTTETKIQPNIQIKKWQIDKNSNEIMPLYQTPLWSLSLSVSSSVFYGSRSLVRHCGRASGRQKGPRGQR